MHTIHVVTDIRAPRERCFDLARSMDLHKRSADATREAIVAGVHTGLIGLNEEVTFEAHHLGACRRMTSRVTAYDRPTRFRDAMIEGEFRRFEHDHLFDEAADGVTRMTDVVCFAAPYGPLGWVAERALLGWYLARFLRVRANVIKDVAETDQWRAYVS